VPSSRATGIVIGKSLYDAMLVDLPRPYLEPGDDIHPFLFDGGVVWWQRPE
jgi:hypothetical protein